jgi:hypothetical protein
MLRIYFPLADSKVVVSFNYWYYKDNVPTYYEMLVKTLLNPCVNCTSRRLLYNTLRQKSELVAGIWVDNNRNI